MEQELPSMSDVVNAKLRSTGATDEKACGVKQILGMVGYILGLYRVNGKENGSYYLGFRVYIGII